MQPWRSTRASRQPSWALARVQLALDPNADVADELRQAIQNDPNLKDAHLELANYLLTHDEAQKALDVLDQAGELLADSPLFYMRRAQAELALGKGAEAYDDALKANQMDQTLLDSYRLLAQAAARTQHFDQALEAIKVYLTYEQQNPDAWLIQGMALYGQGKYNPALESLNKALELDKKLPEAQLYHGLTLMELGQGQEAVNEIYLALQSDPRSFELNLFFSRALLVAGRLGDALGQVNRSYDLAEGDAQLAQALLLASPDLRSDRQPAGSHPGLEKDPGAARRAACPQEQLDTAQAHIQTTSTPVPTATRTPTLTRTPRPGAITTTPTGGEHHRHTQPDREGITYTCPKLDPGAGISLPYVAREARTSGLRLLHTDCKNFIGITAPYLVRPLWRGYNHLLLSSRVF